MGMTKRSSASVGVGCGLAAAAVVAFATWPTSAEPGSGAVPGATSAVELTGSDDESVARAADGTAFELEIDPELDARFGPRPVNGVRAAEIAVDAFGGRVVAVELDEEGGRPIWEVELVGAAVDEIDVDAIDGRIR